MGLTFENPLWLLGLALILPVAWTGLRWLQTMSRARAWSAVVARSVLIALVCAMLAGASAVQTSRRVAAIAVIDVSESVRQLADRFGDFGADDTGKPLGATQAIRRWLAAATAERRVDQLLGVVAFDGQAIALATPGAGSVEGWSLDLSMRQGTDIEGALRFAEALFPPDAARRLVLVSDGVETSGDARRFAAELAARAGAAGRSRSAAVPIDVLPISYRVDREVVVEAVDAPPQAARESTIAVRVVLNATEPATGTLDLLYEGERLDIRPPGAPGPGLGRRLALRAGRNVETVEVRLKAATIHRLEAVFTPDDESTDRLAGNNRAESFTVTPGPGSVLLVDGVGPDRPDSPGLTLARTLERAGIRVQTIPPEQLPTDLLRLQGHDLIILQNVPAEAMERATHKVLAEYVSTLGGGLIMVGGPDSFGAGGWNNTELAKVLPVRLDLPEQIVAPQVAVVMVIDNSGSMRRGVAGSSRTQQEIVNEGAAAAIETLDKTDLVGVIAFNSQWGTVVPMGRNTDPRRNADAVRAIASGGGTNMWPAIEEGGRLLRQSDARVRRMIVLTDGISEGDPESGIALIAQLRKEGITVSSIGVGDELRREELAEIAKVGGGTYYEVIDPTRLPRIFLREVRVVRQPLIREQRFVPRGLGSASPAVAGLPERLPALAGLVLTRRREDPKITYALEAPTGEPLLAHWFVGRGQVAAWTSDAWNWAREWIDTPAYAQLWTQLARAIARPPADQRFELATEFAGDELVLRLDAADDDGRPIDRLAVPGTVYAPDGRALPVRLEQTGPGSYEARLPAGDRGNYIAALTPQLGERRMAAVVGGASRAIGPEFRRLRSDVGLLRDLAAATGGRVLDLATPKAADLFDRAGLPPTRAAQPLWPVLLTLSLVVFVLDVATRRIAWDRLWSRAGAEAEAARAGVRRRAEAAAATVASLKERGQKLGEKLAGAAPPPPPPPPPAIDEERARRAAEQALRKAELDRAEAERQRRLDEQAQVHKQTLRTRLLGRLGRSDEPGAPESPAAPGEPPAADQPGGSTADLLAARRRARGKPEG
ncbi:MAG: VWA domain-containing protein [Phycisphaerales bacterium]|nr:VWA domain-containing protein [Phycisphaerales bacterium]